MVTRIVSKNKTWIMMYWEKIESTPPIATAASWKKSRYPWIFAYGLVEEYYRYVVLSFLEIFYNREMWKHSHHNFTSIKVFLAFKWSQVRGPRWLWKRDSIASASATLLAPLDVHRLLARISILSLTNNTFRSGGFQSFHTSRIRKTPQSMHPGISRP